LIGGVIDRDYTGELKVILINHGKKCFKIKGGHRIAQLIIEKIATPKAVYYDEGSIYPMIIHEFINEESRALKGFGSTGK